MHNTSKIKQQNVSKIYINLNIQKYKQNYKFIYKIIDNYSNIIKCYNCNTVNHFDGYTYNLLNCIDCSNIFCIECSPSFTYGTFCYKCNNFTCKNCSIGCQLCVNRFCNKCSNSKNEIICVVCSNHNSRSN